MANVFEPHTLQTGKYSGKSVDEVMQVDQQYVWFLSQRNLTHVQLLKFKSFFDSCPGVVQRANKGHSQDPPILVVKWMATLSRDVTWLRSDAF
jgi:hypothetical protein